MICLRRVRCLSSCCALHKETEMKQYPYPYPDTSLLGHCLALAHATFYDALPSNAQHRAPTAPATLPPKRAPAGGPLQRWTDALDNWFYRQRLKDREAYLAD